MKERSKVKLVIEVDLDIGKALHQARVRHYRRDPKNNTSSKVAELAGIVDRFKLHRIETGEDAITPQQLLKLQEIYGIKLVELVIDDNCNISLEVIRNDYRGSDFCKLICQSKVSLNNHDFTTDDAKVILERWVDEMPIPSPEPQTAREYTNVADRTDYLLCDRIVSRLNNKSFRVKNKVRDIYEFAQGLTKFGFYYEDLIQ